MKINVYTTHDKLSAMTEATSELVIWRNGRLATLNPDHAQPYGLLERHALLVRDGRIAAIVAEDDVPSGRSIDLEGRLVTPGLIDCHTHLVFGGSRAQEWEQRLNGVSYQTISASGGGINSTVRATRDSSEAELLALAQPRLERLLREGVTTLEIKSGYGLDLPNERKMLRVARQLADHNGVELSATLLSAHATPPEYQGDADGYITLVCETILPTLWQEGLFESVDVFCENVGFSPQQTERVFQAAQALREAVADCQRAGKRTLVLGGGHETAFGHGAGVLDAFPGEKVGIINLDAHLDLRFADCASSGTPFRQLALECDAQQRGFHYTCIGVSRAANTQALWDEAARRQVAIVEDLEVLTAFETRVLPELERNIAQFDRLYLTIDLDVLPAREMPAVSAPAALGVPLATLLRIVEPLCRSGKLQAVDLVEFNPLFDIDGQGARAAARVAWQIAHWWR
ncbi:imidazolonepropionase [Klebsiella pneumoniae]|nr:imidazolonepropionase [Klebsiella pneumoniae]